MASRRPGRDFGSIFRYLSSMTNMHQDQLDGLGAVPASYKV